MNKNMKNSFLNYMKKTYDFCPYLENSHNRNLVKVNSIILTNKTPEQLSEELFYIFLESVEIFRLNRSRIEKKLIPFYTLNIVFDVESDTNYNWEEIISWPHYMMKYLYSKEQIMFGKFWKDEMTKSKFKEGNIPVPDINFLSVRTAVKNKDPQLLSKSKKLATEIENSSITNKSVIKINENTIDIFNIEELKESDYYNYLKNLILKNHKK